VTFVYCTPVEINKAGGISILTTNNACGEWEFDSMKYYIPRQGKNRQGSIKSQLVHNQNFHENAFQLLSV
jgi:hypothetical protein